MSSDILDSVGLKDHLVKISNRKLIEGFLRGLGIQSQNDLDHLIRIIDKMGKIGSEQAEREFTRAGLSKDKVKRILGFADMGGDPDKVLGELESKLPKGCALRLVPENKLLRDTDFVEEVARFAVQHNLPVRLEGSVLSHVFYILRRNNVSR